MDHDDAKSIAVDNLTKDANLDELREAVRDLRALSADSALADLVEAKMARGLADLESEQREVGGEGK